MLQLNVVRVDLRDGQFGQRIVNLPQGNLSPHVSAECVFVIVLKQTDVAIHIRGD